MPQLLNWRDEVRDAPETRYETSRGDEIPHHCRFGAGGLSKAAILKSGKDKVLEHDCRHVDDLFPDARRSADKPFPYCRLEDVFSIPGRRTVCDAGFRSRASSGWRGN